MSSRGQYVQNMTTTNLRNDQGFLQTNLGRLLSAGPTSPTRLMAPGSIWLDTSNKLVKYNSGTLASPTWTTLAAGSTASALTASVTIDGTTNDLTLITTDQATGTANVTIPDFAGVNQIVTTYNFAGTFTAAQTFGKADIHIMDTDESHDTVLTNASALTADRTLTLTHRDAASVLTFAHDFITVGAFSLTLTTSNTTDITLPTTGTVATLAGAEVFTNKTLDCNGTGNVVSNANAAELEPITIDGTTETAVPFVITKTFTNLDNTGTDVYTDNAPFKMKILDAYWINTSAGGGDWQINKGKNGALGNAITTAKTVAGTDNLLDRATSIDDAEYEIAANGSLVAVGDAGGTIDGILVVTAVRSD